MAGKKQAGNKLLITSEAARLLNRSTQSVILYEKSGRLRSLKTERGWRLFRESDVRKLAEELGE